MRAAPAGAVGARPAYPATLVTDPILMIRPYPRGDHSWRYCLGREETAPQIGFQNQVPVVPGDFERRLTNIASGIVHQNVYVSEASSADFAMV